MALSIAGLNTPSLHATPTYIPVVNGQFTMGQWNFEGSKSSLGGNAALMFVPAMRFTNKFSILPTLESTYRGTRSAEELAGGNNLFQDTWENGASVKFVHGLNQNWTLRENVGARQKWFRETVDETWNQGLYDYRIFNVGTEIERHWGKRASVAMSYDFSLLKFPNYQSLESTQSGDQAREFSGTNVLDNRIHLVTLRNRITMPMRISTQIMGLYSPRYYTDQTVVEASGLLSSEKRKDDYYGGNLSVDRPFKTSARTQLIASLRYGYAALKSNQNHYDARVTTFIPSFYDYQQHSVGTQFSLAVGFGNNPSPMMFDLGLSASRRNYTDRVIQSESGAYLSEKLYVNESSINLGYSYPLAKNFRLRVSSTFGSSSSNNQYESVYRYNFHDSNYQFGFTYDY